MASPGDHQLYGGSWNDEDYIDSSSPESVFLNIRERRFHVSTTLLSFLPDSLLVSLFPNGIAIPRILQFRPPVDPPPAGLEELSMMDVDESWYISVPNSFDPKLFVFLIEYFGQVVKINEARYLSFQKQQHQQNSTAGKGKKRGGKRRGPGGGGGGGSSSGVARPPPLVAGTLINDSEDRASSAISADISFERSDQSSAKPSIISATDEEEDDDEDGEGQEEVAEEGVIDTPQRADFAQLPTTTTGTSSSSTQDMISTPNGHPSGYTKNKKKRFSIKRLAKLLIPLFSTKSSPSVGDATLTTNHPITPLPPPPPVFNPFPGTRLIRYVCMLREELDFYLIPFNSADGFSSAAAASYSSSTNDTAPSPSNNNRLSRLPFYLRWMGSSSSNSNNNKKHNTSNSSVLQFSKSESRLRIHGMAPSSSLTQQQQPPLPSEFAHSSTSALMEGCSGAASNTSVLSLGEKIEDENVALVKVLVGEELARRRKINPASSLATATFVLSGNSSSNLAKANDVSSGKAGNLASPPHPFLGRFKSGSSTGSGAGGAANTNNSQSSFLSQQTQLPRAGSTESITNSSSAATQNVFLGALSAHAHSCDDWMFRELEKSKNKLMSVAMMCLKSEKEVTPLSDVEEKLRKDLASTMDNISSATSALASGDTGRGGIGGVAHQTQSQQPSPSTPSATNLTKDSSPQPSLITSVQQQSNIVTSTAGIYNAIASHKPVRKCWWETTVVHIDGSEFNQKKRRFSQSSHATGGDMGAGGGEGEGSDAAGDIMSAAAEGVSGSGRVASENRQAAYSKHGGAGASHQMNRTTAAVTSASSFHQYSLDQAVRQDILPPLVSRESVVSTASSANTVEYSNPDMDSEMPVNAGTSSSNNNSSSMPQAGSAPSYSNSSPILNLDVPLPPQSTSSTPGGSKNNGTTPPKKPKTNTGSKSSFISKSKNKAKNKTNKVKKSSKQASGGQENLDNNHSDEEIPFKRLEVRVWLRRAWIIEYCQV